MGIFSRGMEGAGDRIFLFEVINFIVSSSDTAGSIMKCPSFGQQLESSLHFD